MIHNLWVSVCFSHFGLIQLISLKKFFNKNSSFKGVTNYESGITSGISGMHFFKLLSKMISFNFEIDFR